MSKKKSSKKSIKKLHLDKPTSHGGWPDGHSGSYMDSKTPVNKQITKFLSDMGLLDDDNPRARLSEDKIRVRRVVLEGLLRKLLLEANNDFLSNTVISTPALPYIEYANNNLDQTALKFDKLFNESILNFDLFSYSDLIPLLVTKDQDTGGVFFENLVLSYLVNLKNTDPSTVINTNKIKENFPLFDFYIGDLKELSRVINDSLATNNNDLDLPGNFVQVKGSVMDTTDYKSVFNENYSVDKANTLLRSAISHISKVDISETDIETIKINVDYYIPTLKLGSNIEILEIIAKEETTQSDKAFRKVLLTKYVDPNKNDDKFIKILDRIDSIVLNDISKLRRHISVLSKEETDVEEYLRGLITTLKKSATVNIITLLKLFLSQETNDPTALLKKYDTKPILESSLKSIVSKFELIKNSLSDENEKQSLIKVLDKIIASLKTGKAAKNDYPLKIGESDSGAINIFFPNSILKQLANNPDSISRHFLTKLLTDIYRTLIISFNEKYENSLQDTMNSLSRKSKEAGNINSLLTNEIIDNALLIYQSDYMLSELAKNEMLSLLKGDGGILEVLDLTFDDTHIGFFGNSIKSKATARNSDFISMQKLTKKIKIDCKLIHPFEDALKIFNEANINGEYEKETLKFSLNKMRPLLTNVLRIEDNKAQILRRVKASNVGSSVYKMLTGIKEKKDWEAKYALSLPDIPGQDTASELEELSYENLAHFYESLTEIQTFFANLDTELLELMGIENKLNFPSQEINIRNTFKNNVDIAFSSINNIMNDFYLKNNISSSSDVQEADLRKIFAIIFNKIDNYIMYNLESVMSVLGKDHIGINTSSYIKRILKIEIVSLLKLLETVSLLENDEGLSDYFQTTKEQIRQYLLENKNSNKEKPASFLVLALIIYTLSTFRMKDLDVYRSKYSYLFVKQTIDYDFKSIFSQEDNLLNKKEDEAQSQSQLKLLADPDGDETTQIPDTNIEIAADPEEHEEDKEDLAMVAESKLYRMVLKDLFEHLNR